MNSRTKKLITIVAVLVLSLGVFTSTALAHGSDPTDPQPGNGSWLGQMQQWMDQVHGPGSWGQMIQWMNQVHGPEFTGQMLQWMNETGGCHGDGEGFPGMMDGTSGSGMMGYGAQAMMGGATANMMGQGFGR